MLQIKGRTVWSSVNSVCDRSSCVKVSDSKDLSVKQCDKPQAVTPNEVVDANIPKIAAKVISSPGVSMDATLTAETVSKNVYSDSDVTAKVISAPMGDVEGHKKVGEAPIERGSVNYDKTSFTQIVLDNSRSIYDVNSIVVLDKFVNSILHVNQFSGTIPDVDTEIYHKFWICTFR